MTTPTPTDLPEAAIVHDICQAVAELPDRNSPEDWPDAMLVTHEELADIVRAALSAAATAALRARGAVPSDYLRIAELVRHARDNRGSKDWPLMHTDLSEAAEIADKLAAAPQPPAALPGEQDAARLDWMQQSASTVEIIRGAPNYDWLFRVGGLHVAERNDIRSAIDAAMAAKGRTEGGRNA